MVKIEDWNEALANRFLDGRYKNQPLYYHVNEAIIREIGEKIGINKDESLKEFEKTLSSHSYGNKNNYLDNWTEFKSRRDWTKSWINWDKGEGAPAQHPPTLAFLAADVLAASRLHDPEFNRRGSFYTQLAQIVGYGSEQTQAFGNYETVIRLLWCEDLNKWLTAHKGNFGLPTASPGIGVRVNNGYSISQIILTGADQSFFKEYLHTSKFDKDFIAENLDIKIGEELLERFTNWSLQNRKPLSKSFLKHKQDRREAVCEVLRQIASHWNGEVKNKKEIKISALPLSWNRRPRVNQPSWELIVEDSNTYYGERDGKELEAVAKNGYIQIGLEHPSQKVYIENEAHGYYYTPPSKALLAWDEDTYRFRERKNTENIEEITVLLSPNEVYLQSELKASFTPKWESEGWQLYDSISIEKLPSKVKLSLGVTEQQIAYFPTLTGGLKLHNKKQVYLSGNGPDLFIPSSPVEIKILINGNYYKTVAAGEEQLLPLRNALLEEGEYQIQAGLRKFTLNILNYKQKFNTKEKISLTQKPFKKFLPLKHYNSNHIWLVSHEGTWVDCGERVQDTWLAHKGLYSQYTDGSSIISTHVPFKEKPLCLIFEGSRRIDVYYFADLEDLDLRINIDLRNKNINYTRVEQR